MTPNKIMNFFEKSKDGKIIRIKIDEITTLPELENAFHMDKDVKERIKADMAENGFNKAHAIHIFRWNEKWVLCDGHTRFAAAKELGLKSIWAQVHSFESLNQALLFSMKEQFNRRNIEDSELFKQFEALSQEEIDGKKLSVAQISERMKKSKRQIFKIQEIFSKSSKEQLDSIRDGKASINQVYVEIKKDEKEKQNLEEEKAAQDAQKKLEEDSASSSILATLPESTFEKSVEKIIEKSELEKNQQKTREIQDKELNLQERETAVAKKEAKLSKRLSDKQILLIGAKFALIQKAKGKSNDEILSSENFDEKIKASDIVFNPEDLELLKAI